MVDTFTHTTNPVVVFGPGRLAIVPERLSAGARVLLVTGSHFAASEAGKALRSSLAEKGVHLVERAVKGEPSPEVVDGIVADLRDSPPDIVLAVGGGSVIDAGKAAAAMLEHTGSVADYLEGVGSRAPEGRTRPLIAVPTTAGTGTEATKNAVISRRGPGGFKKSLRHDAFVPALAVIDPELAMGTPVDITASCGLDAFCQLLEGWTSTTATPMTDALAWEGLNRFLRSYPRLIDGEKNEELPLRSDLGYTAYLSGVVLANAGLGIVHGLAGPLGFASEIPHGTACGLLLEPVFRRMTERALSETPDSPFLHRMRLLGATAERGNGSDPKKGDENRLLDKLARWSGRLPRLSEFGIDTAGIDEAVTAGGNKSAPIPLEKEDFRSVLHEILG